MHKHKKSSNKFLIIGVIVIAILTIILIQLQNQPVDDVLVEVTPVKTTPKPTPVTPAPLTTLYVNNRLGYTVILPGGARLTVTENGVERTVTTLPADAREVRIYSGDTYLSVSDKTYTLPEGTRTQGTTNIGGRSYRSTSTPGQTTIYVREGLTVYYGPTVPSMMLASLRLK